MRIVLDTNVFIFGIFWKGPPQKILEQWALGKIQVLAAENIIEEYLRVIRRLGFEEALVAKWASFAMENARMVKIERTAKLCRDPHDDKFLDCALNGGADYIVSGDKDLLSLKRIEPVFIFDPKGILSAFK